MRKWAFRRNFLVVFVLVLFAISLISSASLSAGQKQDTLPPQPVWWTGYSTVIPAVPVPAGYPEMSTHARYLGELKGSYYDIGVQYGERSGDLIVLVFDGFYGFEGDDNFSKGVSKKMSWEEIKYRVDRYENDSLKWYSPELLEIIRGIADGAKPYLEGSQYYEASGMTPYEMVLAINLYFEINGNSPKIPEFQQTALLSVNSGDEVKAPQECSAIAILPKASATGKLIHASSKDQSFWPQCYQVMYTMVHVGKAGPSGKPNVLFKVGTAGELAGMNVVNDKGVTITGHAGGNIGKGTNPLFPDWTFGVGAQFAIAQAGFFSDNLQEAIDNLVHGSDYYRENTGRKIVQWARGFNCSLSDRESAAAVEENPYRYAVRYPGYMGEKDRAYLVQTNHNLCKFSYDENDDLTDVPMTQFGDGYSSTSASGLDGSGTRFWTLMWLAKLQFGRIDEYVVMNEYWTRDFYFDEQGTMWDPKTGRTVGGGNVNTACSVPADSKNFWTVGTAPDWVGPWDSWVMKENFPKEIPKKITKKNIKKIIKHLIKTFLDK